MTHVKVPRPKKSDSSEVARTILRPPTDVLVGHEEFRAEQIQPRKKKYTGPIKLYVIEKEINPSVIEQLREEILEEEEPVEYTNYQRSRLAEITKNNPYLREKLHRAHQEACGLEVPESAESRSLATYLIGSLRPIGKM